VVNERDKAILLGVAGVGTLAYLAVSRGRAVHKLDCSYAANRTGATVAEPCPTEGPVDVCTQKDFDAWQERLQLQVHAMTTLYGRLEAYSLLGDPAFTNALQSYIATATAAAQQSNPLWTSDSDVVPMAALVASGCELLNQGNAVLARAGYRDQAVYEAGVTVQYAEAARARKQDQVPTWAKVALAAGGVALGYSLLRR